jgi:hypothetical protein
MDLNVVIIKIKTSSLGFSFLFIFMILAQGFLSTNTLFMLAELVFQASNKTDSSTEDTINPLIYESTIRFTISKTGFSYQHLTFIF